LGTSGWNNDVVFDDGVAGTVDVHIEPGTEQMLMDLPHDPRHDLVAVAARSARVACDGIDDARRLDLELDAAVLVEIPVGRVLVVPHVEMDEITRRRRRRTSATSVRQSQRFQPRPWSSSCMQIAFSILTGVPSIPFTQPSM